MISLEKIEVWRLNFFFPAKASSCSSVIGFRTGRPSWSVMSSYLAPLILQSRTSFAFWKLRTARQKHNDKKHYIGLKNNSKWWCTNDNHSHPLLDKNLAMLCSTVTIEFRSGMLKFFSKYSTVSLSSPSLVVPFCQKPTVGVWKTIKQMHETLIMEFD